MNKWTRPKLEIDQESHINLLVIVTVSIALGIVTALIINK